jgi:hypothetical protein
MTNRRPIPHSSRWTNAGTGPPLCRLCEGASNFRFRGSLRCSLAARVRRLDPFTHSLPLLDLSGGDLGAVLGPASRSSDEIFGAEGAFRTGHTPHFAVKLPGKAVQAGAAAHRTCAAHVYRPALTKSAARRLRTSNITIGSSIRAIRRLPKCPLSVSPFRADLAINGSMSEAIGKVNDQRIFQRFAADPVAVLVVVPSRKITNKLLICCGGLSRCDAAGKRYDQSSEGSIAIHFSIPVGLAVDPGGVAPILLSEGGPNAAANDGKGVAWPHCGAALAAG